MDIYHIKNPHTHQKFDIRGFIFGSEIIEERFLNEISGIEIKFFSKWILKLIFRLKRLMTY